MANRSKETGFYFQDDWTATSRLTLTLGVRYEYRGPYRDKRGFATNFNPATGNWIRNN